MKRRDILRMISMERKCCTVECIGRKRNKNNCIKTNNKQQLRTLKRREVKKPKIHIFLKILNLQIQSIRVSQRQLISQSLSY